MSWLWTNSFDVIGKVHEFLNDDLIKNISSIMTVSTYQASLIQHDLLLRTWFRPKPFPFFQQEL